MLNHDYPGHDRIGYSFSRAERAERRAPRARRLNLSDVDWYALEIGSFGSTRELKQRSANLNPLLRV